MRSQLQYPHLSRPHELRDGPARERPEAFVLAVVERELFRDVSRRPRFKRGHVVGILGLEFPLIRLRPLDNQQATGPQEDQVRPGHFHRRGLLSAERPSSPAGAAGEALEPEMPSYGPGQVQGPVRLLSRAHVSGERMVPSAGAISSSEA